MLHARDLRPPSHVPQHNANPCVQFANAVSTSRGLQAGLVIGVVLVAIVIIAAAAVASGHKSGGVVVPSNGKDTLTVLIVGDWGRRGALGPNRASCLICQCHASCHAPVLTLRHTVAAVAATGSHNQTLVAAQMAATAEQTGADFIISVGDNFYSWCVACRGEG